ncbi:MAG: flagellin [Rhodobiaceae bacterium]|nr:flagellin [Rhodobiaceae bacterium]
MSDVVLSGAIRSNLLSLQNTASLLATTNERLATGLKVNSAIDDPTAFFTARNLNTRAADLTNLLDSMDQAVQTLRTADEGIEALTKLIETAKATANQALDTPINASFAEGPRDAVTDQTLNLTAVFSSIASTDQITIAFDGGTAVAITVGGQTVSKFISSINGLSGISASITSNGSFRIEADDGSDLVIASGVGSVATDLGINGTFDNGQNRTQFEGDFNGLRTQIDELAADASYQGINLLSGDDLTVNFNESQTSQLTIQGVTLNSAGLGVTSVNADDFTNDATIRSFIAELDGAISALRAQASTFGANLGVVEIRQGFTDNMVNTLETGAAKLTLADTNEEGANLLALQTRQSLGTTALSIAAQAEQNVLQLF